MAWVMQYLGVPGLITVALVWAMFIGLTVRSAWRGEGLPPRFPLRAFVALFVTPLFAMGFKWAYDRHIPIRLAFFALLFVVFGIKMAIEDRKKKRAGS